MANRYKGKQQSETTLERRIRREVAHHLVKLIPEGGTLDTTIDMEALTWDLAEVLRISILEDRMGRLTQTRFTQA